MSGQIGISINGRFLTQPMTGVQRYAREILKGIDRLLANRRDIRVRLLTPPLRCEPPRLEHVRHVVVGRLNGHAWEQLEFPRFVQGDVVFCPGNTAPLRLLWGRTRTVVTVHDLSYLYFPEAYSRSFRLLYGAVIPQVLRRASAVITVSESERIAITQCYPEVTGRITAIANGGLPIGVQPGSRLDSAEPFVLYVGSLSKRKNLAAMLEVAKRLAGKRQLKFVFIGSTPLGLQRSVAQLPVALRDRIVFAGQINDWTALCAQYSSAKCFFFPSLYESSGLPPMESMGCGCPVVAASIPALVERCGDAAVYCDPNSVDDMSEKLESVLDNENLQEMLRDRGYARAREFSWERCAAQTLAKILEVSQHAL
jgi:glycosyltransferase involved in cell wall biosynthesis